jgi:CRISPR-associated protein Csb2
VTALLLSVRLHDGRYHGRPEWPPAPARLFQALLAGAAAGDGLAEADRDALAWLEGLEPPAIAAPPSRLGQGFRSFVPNNDLDAVGGDPDRIAEIRAPKAIRPVLIDPEIPLLYLWRFPDTAEAGLRAAAIVRLAAGLYQLGRGVDMAWAAAELLPEEAAADRLLAHRGPVYRPAAGTSDRSLAVPVPGSLASLIDRHGRMRSRLATAYRDAPTRKDPARKIAIGTRFSNPPRPRFRQAAYDAPPHRFLFDLLGEAATRRQDRAVALTEQVRGAAAARLAAALPEKAALVQAVVVGSVESAEADKAARLRIVPLPSIGHRQADRAIRRVLVEVPPDCPLAAGDLRWAFAGLTLAADARSGEVLAEAADTAMLGHYGVGARAQLWRSVTPAALPVGDAARPPPRRLGSERAAEESAAIGAVLQALRHAGIAARPAAVRVQREPFEAKGATTEAFAAGTRFPVHRLWHVELTLREPVAGPLLLGDGRYLGLGLMAPVPGDGRRSDAAADRPGRDVFAWSLPEEARPALAERPALLRAFRRALMSLASDPRSGAIPPLISGHEPDGGPAASGRHRHLFLVALDGDGDGRIDQLLAVAPWRADRSPGDPGPAGDRERRRDRFLLRTTARRLTELRAGRLGRFALVPAPPDPRLLSRAAVWESHTPYRPTRHAGRGKDPGAALLADAEAECLRRGLAAPTVEMLEPVPGPGGGSALLRLRFARAIGGPILLGRDSHAGGGLFLPAGS